MRREGKNVIGLNIEGLLVQKELELTRTELNALGIILFFAGWAVCVLFRIGITS